MWPRKVKRLNEMSFIRVELCSWMLRANFGAESSMMMEQ